MLFLMHIVIASSLLIGSMSINNIYDKFYERLEIFSKIPGNWNNAYQIFDHSLGRLIIGLFKREIPNTYENTFVRDDAKKCLVDSSEYYNRLAKELQLVIDRDFT